MKSTILTLFSALVLGQGVHAHAEGFFAKAFQSKLRNAASEEAQLNELGSRLDLKHLEPENAVKSDVAQVSYCGAEACCDTSCDAGCDSGCGSFFGAKMCPGTGAFGGDSRFAGTIGLNQDTFFGNYTTVAAGYALNSAVDVTFYSILWHTDFFSQSAVGGIGAAAVDGTGLWTEFGGGLNFKLLGGALNVNPQMGILNGSLLSGIGNAGLPKVFDGVVPNLIVSYDDTFFESEFYGGWYLATRGPSAAQADFLHWWLNGGIKPWGDSCDWKSMVSTGIHYEMLRNSRTNQNLYSWIGPYFQVALPNGLSMRYSMGWNTERNNPVFGIGDNFYKVNIGYDF